MIRWSIADFLLGFLFSIFIFGYLVLFRSLPDPPELQPKFVGLVPEKPNAVKVERELRSAEELISEGNAQIGKELESIVDLIIKDFVESWFAKIDRSADAEFLKVMKWKFLQTLLVVKGKLMKNDSASLIVLKLLPIFNKHFSTFCDAREAVLSDLTLERQKAANIDLQIAVEFNKNYKLHKSLSLKPNALENEIEESIRKSVIGLLPYIFDNNELDSLFVFTLMTEVLTTCIISPLIIKLSDPDNWNLKIVSISQNYFEEKNKVHKIRRMLSKELQDHRNAINDVTNKNVRDSSNEKLELSVNYTGKQFEHYLNRLDSMTDISDIKYVAFSLALKIYQLKDIEHLSKEDLKYKKRLLLSLNLIESKSSYSDSGTKTENERTVRDSNYSDLNMDSRIVLKEMNLFFSAITLREIIDDSKCLPFFKSFLGSVSKSQGSTFLEYSQTIESFKNPLEDATSEDIISGYSGINNIQLQEISSKFFQNDNLQNMKLLDEGLVRNVILFTGSLHMNNDEETFILARKSVLLLQAEAIKYLDDKLLPLFKSSPFFLKMLSTPDIISTDIYVHFLTMSSSDNNAKQNKAIRETTKIDFMNPVRIFANPGITDALDNIVNGSDLKLDKAKKSANPQYSQLFGSDNNNIFKDKLFDDDNDNTSEFYLAEDQLDLPHSVGKSSTSSKNWDSIHSQHYGSNNFRDNIASLTISIDQIEKELELLRHLILKADLTNNQTQLKILKKSQRTLLKELEMKELLKQQYMVQENANSLFRKTKIYIRSYFSEGSSKSLTEITYYIINIHHFNNGQVSSWDMARRFNEFFDLNAYLKKNYKPLMKQLQDLFPSKVKMSLKHHVTKTLLHEERKQKLEKYLRELLSISEICRDDIFRRFLTDPASFRLDKDYMHDDVLEERPHELNSSSNSTSNSSSVVDLQTSKDDEELNFYEDERHFFTDSGYPFYSQNKSFVKQICDLFISLFQLNKANSGWLRGRAIITVLQQLLGSTIEKYIKVSIQKLRSEDQTLEAIIGFKNMLWGDNGLLERKRNETTEPVRTKGEKLRTEKDALTSLQRLFAEICGRVVGLRDSHEAAGRVHAMLQNPYLNASLLLEALDAVLLDIICTDEHEN
ncbi:Intermediate filament protein [Saccharomyces pastorianus]|uniref:Intermediate filament protein n=1 Tax=Saccharomyces pastorianus TaxID=27292 RepID=A0A6C1ED98_SACPS|nr:Intermediate filament protein [Saccharomyces pastorianus]